ncbi:3-oxoadipate enol-lactonase [Paroceanicella profunda]|uniref:3-oxoadipate enol-lactonase n=1 Tax=Paroceanicella profunda TaxID=2579971 RepID=A0A5B8FFZ0_9RHOB|nr:3-oxoadipate enol-lactonase [Paroceanicella profunda]QDL90477.1 3-oxoadipate enol-lactonase [Paroceanicella profunda]
MQIATINGVKIHHAVTGPESGRAVLFINSLGTDFRVWDRVLPLLPEGTRVIRYDKRGHGLSECPAAPYFMGDLVAEAAGLLDHLGVGRVLVVGLSIGGQIAQGLAAERPDLVEAMVLSNTAAKIGTPDSWDTRIEEIHKGGIAALEEAILSRWFSRAFRESRPEELAGWRHMLCRTPEDGYVGCCYAIKDTDLVESTGRLTLPTLAIAGDEDGSTPPDLVRETAGLIPGARFHLVRGAGHLPCVEQPADVAAALTEFMKETALVREI